MTNSIRAATPFPVAFRRATPSARADASIATTRAAGTSWASATAIAPLPVPTSTTTGSSPVPQERSADSIRASVSGLGASTSDVTANGSDQNSVLPVMCETGRRRARSAT